MKKKIYLISIILLLSLNLIPFHVFAADKLHADLYFDGVIKDNKGVDWVEYNNKTSMDDLGNVNFSGNRAILDDSGIGVNNIGLYSFINNINTQKDFRIETTFNFTELNVGERHDIFNINIFSSMVGLWYNPSIQKFEYQLLLDSGGYLEGTFDKNYNIIPGKDIDLVFGRTGNNIILSIDGLKSTPVPIPGEKLSVSLLGIVGIGYDYGSDSSSFSKMSLLNFKIISNSSTAVVPPVTVPDPVQEVKEIEKNVEVNVRGGELDINLGVLNFNPILFKSSEIQKTTGNSLLTILDERTNGAGWSVKVKSTDFTRVVSDPSGGSGDITVKFPSNNLKLIPGEIKVLSGQLLNNTYGPYTQNLTLGNLAQDIITSKPGFGMGKYEVLLDYELTIPKKVEIVNISGVGSKYSVGDEIGVMEGTYTATVTYTIGSGL